MFERNEKIGLIRVERIRGGYKMAKKSRGGRMTAAKFRASKSLGGRGMVKNRTVGKNIMRT